MVAGCVSKKEASSFFFFLRISTSSSSRSLSSSLSPLPSRRTFSNNRTVPVRVVGDGRLTTENVRVLLVTSRSGAGLVFPKGGWETDESCEAAAARETVEEAGVRGDLEPEPLGTFHFASSKKEQSSNNNRSGREERKKSSAATMFALRVREELTEWPESAQRCRVWLSPGDALAACKHAWMREALGAWAARHGIGGSGEGEEGARRNGGGDASPSPPSPLEPSPGGRERAAAAAIKAAKATGLTVVPWIRIAGEEDEGGGGEGTKPVKSAAVAEAETK